MYGIMNQQKERRYNLKSEVASMPDGACQQIINVSKAYCDIVGTYKALFDELGELGEYNAIVEQVRYLNIPLMTVEEYVGCLPEKVEDLIIREIDEVHENEGMWSIRKRLLTFIPIYLLDRVRYLVSIRKQPNRNDMNSLDFLFELCKRKLKEIEDLVYDTTDRKFEKHKPMASTHVKFTPTTVDFDGYLWDGVDSEMYNLSVSIPVSIYDMLRNDDLIGFHVAFLNYDFSVEFISNLFETMEDLSLLVTKQD